MWWRLGEGVGVSYVGGRRDARERKSREGGREGEGQGVVGMVGGDEFGRGSNVEEED